MSQPPTHLIVVGPAGSGKSALSMALCRWLREDGKDACCFNLDPGAEYLPYKPAYDIRDLVRLDSLMAREGLGPNGALIRAAEVAEARLGEVMGAMEAKGMGYEYRIIDTPGQMEVFLYRDLGPKLASGLGGRVVAVSLMDPALLRRGSDLVALRLMGLMVELRLNVAVVEVVSKSDAFPGDLMARLEAGGGERSPEEGLSGELARRLDAALSPLRKRRRLIPVSAKNGTGMEELYMAVGEALCACGDQT